MKSKLKNYTQTSNMILFWNSGFSQWYMSEFKDSNNRKFFNAEQFMMYHKAKIFKDTVAQAKILDSINPRLIKEYGRQVKNFSDDVWTHHREQIVILGNYYKFTQDKLLYQLLMESDPREIVEASPEDSIWGIGLHEEDYRCLDKSQWRGLNLLGKCIMRVRDIITNNSEDDISYIKSLEELYK